MPMKMQVVVVLVEVGMRSDLGRMAGRKFFAEPFHGAGEVEKAEQDEHEANREFHREARARRNSHAEDNDFARAQEKVQTESARGIHSPRRMRTSSAAAWGRRAPRRETR